MKAKLMALVLAAGLGVTGIAVTAQAAGRSSDQCPNGHVWITIKESESYEENGWLGHTKHVEYERKCDNCQATSTGSEDIDEGHTFRQHPFENVWECIYCGYTE